VAKSTTLTEALSTLLYWTILTECDKKFHFHALVDGNSSKLLHFVFRLSIVYRLKMTRFFGALLHFGFACPQFVI